VDSPQFFPRVTETVREPTASPPPPSPPQDPLGPGGLPLRRLDDQFVWTWRINRASIPASRNSRSTRIIAILIRSAALPGSAY